MKKTIIGEQQSYRSWCLCVLAGLALMLSGCGEKKKTDEPEKPVAQVETEAPKVEVIAPLPAEEPDLSVMSISVVAVEPAVEAACGVRTNKAYFEFDSAKVGQEAQERLQQIADCVTKGPLKGESLVLVGHTDPRGSDEYNRQLGMSRSESVKRHLINAGVDSSRIETKSRGEQGTKENMLGWPYERRVDIRLASSGE